MIRFIAIASLIVLTVPANAQTPLPSMLDSPPPLPSTDPVLKQQTSPVLESNPAYGPLPKSAAPVPISSGPFQTGDMTAVAGSGTIADRMLKKVSFEADADQIRFDVQVMQVDAAVRDAIYEVLSENDVNTEITQIDPPSDPNAQEASLASVHRIASGSIVTTAVMNQKEARALTAIVYGSESSDITARPTMIVSEGQVGAIQQQVQRPFLSKLEEVKVGDQSSVRPDIHVLNEGFDFAVQAKTEGDTLHVRTKLQHSRVVGVKQHHVYGIGKGRKNVQVPSHEVRIAAASEKLKPGQTLLLDPYLETERAVVKAPTTPVIGQFLPSAKPTVQRRNTLVLLTATKIKPVQNAKKMPTQDQTETGR
ncbi:MAG: hypothetical protein AAFX06_14685 [Planctomycetota bacterium]